MKNLQYFLSEVSPQTPQTALACMQLIQTQGYPRKNISYFTPECLKLPGYYIKETSSQPFVLTEGFGKFLVILHDNLKLHMFVFKIWEEPWDISVIRLKRIKLHKFLLGHLCCSLTHRTFILQFPSMYIYLCMWRL